ncbi:hypothetical protein ALNOE001_15970 [Candidatus Methanobinarius endosymbioticus]|uniref:Hydrogenase 3 maturation protease n=1 Tax=Candidatus Methanobinarius endosymbioticus TaxID=2006182 RepID=A0A366M981_9EURY|nr:hypothetical protein ALNOE001_15970 [Candidatus Methanobinarius endosymbioticus]
MEGYKKLVIMGIGNELRGDDSLGPHIINELESSKKLYGEKIVLINGGSAPENFTSLIKSEKPSHILMIDATLMNSRPSSIKFLNKEEIANINTSTHSMSLSFLIKFLEQYLSFKFLLIGIEPLSMNLGDEISPKVLESENQIKNTIISTLRKINNS